jgi:hypothetical protein
MRRENGKARTAEPRPQDIKRDERWKRSGHGAVWWRWQRNGVKRRAVSNDKAEREWFGGRGNAVAQIGGSVYTDG